MLGRAGCDPVGTIAFGDHHSYEAADIERLVRVGREQSATGFITTEKDAVKLTGEMRARLATIGPLVIAALDAVFVDEAGVVRDLEARIG
jgi:tetraacyldisaccharide 4'-kinase